MIKDEKGVGVEPASAEFCPPITPIQNCDDAFPLAPEMAELRYRLMVRRGQAWANPKRLEHAF
jgi:hypothetical protein